MEREPREIVLIQYPGFVRNATMSPPCGKVHMALRFKGLRCKLQNAASPAEARRLTPRGRLPTLIVDGRVIPDSSDILDELDRIRPEPPLLPADPLLRAQARVLEDWADEVLYFLGVWFRFGSDENYPRVAEAIFARASWPMRRVGTVVLRKMMRKRLHSQGTGDKEPEAIAKELGSALDTLVQLLADRPFLLGKEFSRADLSLCALLDQMDLPELTPGPSAMVRARPGLAAWRLRVRALCGNAAEGQSALLTGS